MKCYFVLFFIFFSLKFSNESKMSTSSKRKFKKKMKEIDNMYSLIDSESLQNQEIKMPDFKLNTIDKNLEVVESLPRFEQSEISSKNNERSSKLKTFGIDEPVTKIKEITYRKPIYINEDPSSFSRNSEKKNEDKSSDDIDSKFLQTSLTEDKKEIVFNSNTIEIEAGTRYRKAIVLGSEKALPDNKEVKKLIVVGRNEIKEDNIHNSNKYINNTNINTNINSILSSTSKIAAVSMERKKVIDVKTPETKNISKNLNEKESSLESIDVFGEKLSELIKNILVEVVRDNINTNSNNKYTNKQPASYEKIIENNQPKIKDLIKKTFITELYKNSSLNFEHAVNDSRTTIKEDKILKNQTHPHNITFDNLNLKNSSSSNISSKKSEKTKLIIKSITTKDKINLTSIANKIIKENKTNSTNEASMFPTPLYNNLKFIEKKTLLKPIVLPHYLLAKSNTKELLKNEIIENKKIKINVNLNLTSSNASTYESESDHNKNHKIANTTKTSKGLITELEKEILSKIPIKNKVETKSFEKKIKVVDNTDKNQNKDYKKILEDIKKKVNSTHNQLDKLIEENNQHNKKFELLQKRTLTSSHNLNKNVSEKKIIQKPSESQPLYTEVKSKKKDSSEVKKSKLDEKSDVDESSMISELLKSLK